MKLQYSVNGVPYIETDYGDKIIFSVHTEDPVKGFKWLCVSAISTETLPLSAGSKAKNKKTITVVTPVSFFVDVGLNKITKKQIKSINIPSSDLQSLKRILKNMVKDGFLHRESLQLLEKEICSINILDNPEDFLDDDPMGYCEEDVEEEDDD